MRSTTMDQEDRDKGGGQGDLQGIARMSRVRKRDKSIWEGNRMEKFARCVDKISRVFRYGGMIVLFFMMMLGTADVVGRYFFNRPLTGTFEIFEMLLPFLVLLGLADTQFVNEHITAGVIDFFRLKPETRTKIQLGVQVLVFCLFGLIIWQGVEGSMFTLRSHRRFTNIDLPMWVPQLVVPLGALVMCIVVVFQVLETANKIRRKT